MKILYIASMFEESDLETLFCNASKISYAANKYNMLFCEGLAQNGVEVEAVSFLPVTRSNCKKVIVKKKSQKRETLTVKYPTTLNFSGVKHILRCMNMFFRVLFSRRGTIIFFDLFALSPNVGMILAAKIRRLKRVCIVTDLPEHLPSHRKILKLERKIISDASAYVLLTKQMNERVNKQNKPAIVLEGHIDYELVREKVDTVSLPQKSSKRIVMYAGALHERYGIANLISSFIRIHKDNELLQVYGSGDYVEKILELAKEHPSIQYCGVKPNRYIVEAEKKADLLVNPRTAEGEYTKYSFPSKVLEYMASGVPVLMARLPGIPDEYYDYVYTFDDKSSEGLDVALRSVLDKDKSELKKLGFKAQNFVFANKSCITQARKVIEWIPQI